MEFCKGNKENKRPVSRSSSPLRFPLGRSLELILLWFKVERWKRWHAFEISCLSPPANRVFYSKREALRVSPTLRTVSKLFIWSKNWQHIGFWQLLPAAQPVDTCSDTTWGNKNDGCTTTLGRSLQALSTFSPCFPPCPHNEGSKSWA